MDIPKLAHDNNLLEGEGICSQHILYTDNDVLFANEIKKSDVQTLAAMTGDAVAMYGRQYFKRADISNSGVMVMNVKQYMKEVPLMLDHIKNWGTEQYPQYTQPDGWDQRIVNNYRASSDITMAKFKLLPLHYNWKPYWGLEPSSFEQVKIIHFHGPKPGRVLDEMGKCNLTWDKSVERFRRSYKRLFDEGVCCDQGRTADWSLKAVDVLRPQTNTWD